jgi:hypothetical protein
MQNKRIPIFLLESEVGGNLPSERRYHYSGLGAPIGYILVPEGKYAVKFSDSIEIRTGDGQETEPTDIVSLRVHSLVEAAVKGDFGLSWQPYNIIRS